MALVTIIFFGIILFTILLGYALLFKNSSKLMIIAILFIITFLILLAFTTYNSIIDLNEVDDYQKLGPFGDYIGGILNPLIAVFGVFAAGFAFYAQYQANKQVQDQFKIQQFESQFYEMLRMHRENLNEMLIEGYKFENYPNGKNSTAEIKSKIDKLTKGKKIFVTLLNEFESINLIASKVFNFHFKLLTQEDRKKVSKLFNQLIIDHSYYVFFNGISLYEKNIKKYIENDKTNFLRLVLYQFVSELKQKRDKHLNEGIKEYYVYYTSGSLFTNNFKTRSLWLSFNFKPFSGHQSLLAHYYRHLFQTVKFVVKQNDSLISYESKRDYLRILRSMLSNHEQILLYYNWIAGFGSQWEEKDLDKRKKKKGNYFFTDYRMIHNIPNDMLIDEFKLDIIFNENYLDFMYETNRKNEDTLFELVNIKNNLKN